MAERASTAWNTARIIQRNLGKVDENEPGVRALAMKGPLLRLLGILLGVAAAIGLARSGLGFRFRHDFLFLLDALDWLVGPFTWPFDVFIVRPLARYLHEQGVLFELREHWRNAFVLLWLFNSRFLRAQFPSSFQLVITSGTPDALVISFRWIWAGLTALLAGVLAGTVPLAHPAVLWWSAAGYFLFRAGDDVLTTYFLKLTTEARGGVLALVLSSAFALLALDLIDLPMIPKSASALFWWPTAGYFLYLTGLASPHWQSPMIAAMSALTFAIAAMAIAFGIGIAPTPEWLAFEASPSPGLLNLVVFVAIIAVWILVEALLLIQGGRSLFKLWTARAGLGIDILFVVGVATIMVWLARA